MNSAREDGRPLTRELLGLPQKLPRSRRKVVPTCLNFSAAARRSGRCGHALLVSFDVR
jgi:hypothetical protein